MDEMKNNAPMVLFDLDGTLLNTLDDLADATNYALAFWKLPSRTVDEVRRFVGNGLRLLAARAVPEGTDTELVDRVYHTIVSYYGEHSKVKTAPYPGITEMLTGLKENGFLLGVISNKADFAVKALVKFYFPGLFDIAEGEREAEGVRKKPAPDLIFSSVKALGADISTTVFVGDSDVDIDTANNAGIPVFAVGWGFREEKSLLEKGAERVYRNAEELFDALTRGVGY